jgi:hypothetical protein
LAVFILSSPLAFGAKVSLDLVAKGPYRTGQPVEIVYRFEDVGSVKVPPTIDAGGLVFRYVDSRLIPGQSRGELRLDHGRLYVFEAVPDRPGKFVVPKRLWDVGSKKLQSPARTLVVRGSRLAAAPSPTPSEQRKKIDPGGGETDRLKWLQNRAALLATQAPAAASTASGSASQPTAMPSPTNTRPSLRAPVVFAAPPAVAGTNVFLGQAVPVTWEFFLRADTSFQDLLRPSLDGNGFYADPLEELSPNLVTNNGVPYYQVRLQTTVVPLRTGALDIPAATLQGRHSVGAVGQAPAASALTDFSLSSQSFQLRVAALPTDRPDDFTGGVGEFQALAPQVDPLVAGAGEPVSLRLGVEGQGNLRAMQRPVLDAASMASWRAYDAGETVERAGADGSGTKYFEFQLIASRDSDLTPAASLSYFDPRQKKFVRLQFPSEPINAVAAAAAVAAATPSPSTMPTVRQASPPADGGIRASFDPVLQSPWFRAMQALIAIFFLGWILWLLSRRRSTRTLAARRARLRAEYQEALEFLRKAPADCRAFYGAAARVVVAGLGMLDGKKVSREEVGRVLERLVPNLARREELATVLDRSDELEYGAVETGPLDEDEHASIVQLLDAFDDHAS